MELLQTLYTDLQNHEDKAEAQKDLRYHKYSGFRSFGIIAPVLHSILKKYKKEISKLSCKDAFDLAQRLSKKQIEETTHAATYVLQIKLDCFTKENLSFLDTFTQKFTSWSQTDDFAINVLGPLLLKFPKEVLAILTSWNTSENMWQRRLSVVAFVRKVGESGRFTTKALSLCENLLFDKEDLVRKGVGWCLKDVMRGDKSVLEYVMQLKERKVSSTITLYALRDVKKLKT